MPQLPTVVKQLQKRLTASPKTHINEHKLVKRIYSFNRYTFNEKPFVCKGFWLQLSCQCVHNVYSIAYGEKHMNGLVKIFNHCSPYIIVNLPQRFPGEGVTYACVGSCAGSRSSWFTRHATSSVPISVTLFVPSGQSASVGTTATATY